MSPNLSSSIFADDEKLSVNQKVLEKLSDVVGGRSESKVAVIADWEESWATQYFCGFNNEHREYFEECTKWYKPFWENGVSVDVIAMDDDYTKYDLVIAPFLYMLKNGTIERIENYVKNGGNFVTTYLSCMVNSDDLCYLGGFPAENLKEALNGLEIGITTDAINVSVDCAIEELSVLTGEKATETVVNEVFKNFCVGK